MSDIVRRLRKWAERWPDELNTATLVTEAANRIESLESDYHNLVGRAILDDVATPLYEKRAEHLEMVLRLLLLEIKRLPAEVRQALCNSIIEQAEQSISATNPTRNED